MSRSVSDQCFLLRKLSADTVDLMEKEMQLESKKKLIILDPMNEPGPALRDEAIEHRGSIKKH